MRLLDSILRKPKKLNFSPDFDISEYDNWLNFIEMGGTQEEWDTLKTQNNWIFPMDDTEIFMLYQKELKPVFKKYFVLMELIEKRWSVLYHSKDYHSKLASTIEKDCYEAIHYYEEIRTIDLKYNQTPMFGSKAFTKLALLYERRENYEDSIKICKKALSLDIDEKHRLARMIKKAGREPTAEELSLLESL